MFECCQQRFIDKTAEKERHKRAPNPKLKQPQTARNSHKFVSLMFIVEKQLSNVLLFDCLLSITEQHEIKPNRDCNRFCSFFFSTFQNTLSRFVTPSFASLWFFFLSPFISPVLFSLSLSLSLLLIVLRVSLDHGCFILCGKAFSLSLSRTAFVTLGVCCRYASMRIAFVSLSFSLSLPLSFPDFISSIGAF